MNSEIKNLFGGLRRCALRRALLLLLATATAMVVSDAKASTIIRWGRNGYRTTDVPEGLTNAVQLVANVNRVVSLQADGTALAWGASLSAEAAAVTDAKAVSLGTHHGLLLRSNGLVVAWGTGVAGENIVPAGLSNVVGIAAGARHSLAAKSDGTVVAWGANETNQATVPPGLSNVIAVAANGAFDNDAQFSVALKSDGTVAVWGYDSPVFGLQNGAAAVTNAVAIAVSGAHIVVLKADGTLFGWGDNTVNQAIPPMNGVTPCIFDVTFQAISHRTDRTDHELC